MPTTTTFAFNPSTGTAEPGTQQVGNIAYGTPNTGFENSPLKWWNGPNEDLGYIIAKPDYTGLHIGSDGVQAYLGFNRSILKSEASFIELSNSLFNQVFTNGDSAKSWLNSNGYWTSWGLSPSNEGSNVNLSDYRFSLDYAPAPLNGNITFPAHPLVSTSQSGMSVSNPNLVGTEDSNFSYQLYINVNDINGNNKSSMLDLLLNNEGMLTLTQGSNYVVYSFTNQAFNRNQVGIGSNQPYFYDSYFGTQGPGNGASPLGSLNVVTPAVSNFNNAENITIDIQLS